MTIRTRGLGPWALAIAIIAAGCATPPPASLDLTDADTTAIRAAWDALIDARNDWDLHETLMTSDFVHLDPRTPALEGVGPWREWVESMDFGDEQSVYTVDEITGSGDMAFIRWTFTGGWTEGGEVVEANGKGISIYQRAPDGAWKLSRNAWNATP
jgi:ketosteroid isomerase-like protein